MQPAEGKNWLGGDGAPGTGTLREFIIGAIVQHYPKTLNRQAPGDFRFPTTGELDDLDAFQKSLGRRQDLNLAAMKPKFKNEVVQKGVDIFNNPGNTLDPNISNLGAGKCFFCHLNAGASDFFFAGQNANFNTNVEGLPAHQLISSSTTAKLIRWLLWRSLKSTMRLKYSSEVGCTRKRKTIQQSQEKRANGSRRDKQH